MSGETILASQLNFPDVGQTGLSSLNNQATAALARGYDSCIAAAEAAWVSSGSDLNLMAKLGKHIARWCASHTPGPGAMRRMALYAVEDDAAYTKWLRNSKPRRACHLKDALLIAFSPQQVVEQVIIPCTGLFGDSPLSPEYTGGGVWPNSLFGAIFVWADYVGAGDAKSSEGWRSWDILAAPASALSILAGPAADETKATIMTLYGAKLGLFRPALQGRTAIWRSRGYDGTVHGSAAGLNLTRGSAFSGGALDMRCLDIAAATMAVHDSVDLEADVINKTALFSTVCILDTIYATVMVNWTSKDIYGQMMFSVISEQTAGSRWGGPVYAIESRHEQPGGNLWTGILTSERLSNLQIANILQTITESLATTNTGESWHEFALRFSVQELLASPLTEPGEPADIGNILALSKGTFVIISCSSCGTCSTDKKLKLDNWSQSYGSEQLTRIMRALERIRSTVDGSLRSLNENLAKIHALTRSTVFQPKPV
ncbi:hypothetical protein FE257_010142 [Aspergillus nanangensis]|uniref:Uncharacterized protein n=1 Tax=Aspergillus nanangensis TaxID=2582783 RepID=A0AAD4GRL8_ASPNN|nr:hypothetical protein FE257_010142 [Aspergillus nanangensis]